MRVYFSFMDAIKEIYKENGVTFTADKLLCAARHKVLIPLDDDIDRVLFREDYDKSLSILKA